MERDPHDESEHPTGRPRRPRRGTPVRTVAAGLIALGVLCGAASPASARVLGEVLSVGYRAGGDIGLTGPSAVRAGLWTPILVELTLENQATFDGKLRVRQRDSDGDYCYDEVPVHLRIDSGPQKTYCLYAIPSRGEIDCDFPVTLENDRGEVVPVVSAGELVRQLRPGVPPRVIADRDYLIVALTPEDRTIGKITRLVSPEQSDKYWTMLHLGHATPSRMPTQWIGLEMVDCVVWDEADATDLSRPQLTALVEWVRHGGKLVIASARTADTIAQSDLLDPVLPVEIGKVTTTDRLPNLRKNLLDVPPDEDTGYSHPIAVVPCTLRDGLRDSAFVTESILSPGESKDVLIGQRHVGRGQVIFVGAALRDLLSEKGAPAEFFRAVLGLRGSSGQEVTSSAAVFPAVQQQVGFSGIGGAYMVLAILFALAYLGVSTFGVWGFLKSRNWTRYSWAGFAAVAIAASIVSATGVQTVRGVGRKLHQLSVVDLHAGQSEAEATCYFGLKTGTHTKLDVWLPSAYPQQTEPDESPAFIRPLAEYRAPGSGEGGGFTDPTEYRLLPPTAELANVPIRATVKRFEGRWRGVLSGKRVDASIRIRRNAPLRGDSLLDEEESEPRNEDIFLAGSTITNNLGVDLEQCCILQATRDAFIGAGFTCLSPRGTAQAGSIYAHPIRGGIKNGETIDLAQRVYFDANGNPIHFQEWLAKHTLYAAQSDWGRGFSATLGLGRRRWGADFDLDEFQDALLLLTTLSEYDVTTLKGPFGPGLELLADGSRFLDLSDQLTTKTVILIGFANDPGPVTLCTRKGTGRYRPVTPAKAWTMYRIVIPVKG